MGRYTTIETFRGDAALADAEVLMRKLNSALVGTIAEWYAFASVNPVAPTSTDTEPMWDCVLVNTTFED